MRHCVSSNREAIRQCFEHRIVNSIIQVKKNQARKSRLFEQKIIGKLRFVPLCLFVPLFSSIESSVLTIYGKRSEYGPTFGHLSLIYLLPRTVHIHPISKCDQNPPSRNFTAKADFFHEQNWMFIASLRFPRMPPSSSALVNAGLMQPQNHRDFFRPYGAVNSINRVINQAGKSLSDEPRCLSFPSIQKRMQRWRWNISHKLAARGHDFNAALCLSRRREETQRPLHFHQRLPGAPLSHCQGCEATDSSTTDESRLGVPAGEFIVDSRPLAHVQQLPLAAWRKSWLDCAYQPETPRVSGDLVRVRTGKRSREWRKEKMKLKKKKKSLTERCRTRTHTGTDTP